MARTCTICSHPRRAEIDRRLTKGETPLQLAADFSVPKTTLYRHKKECAGLTNDAREKQIEAARGTVALASLPSRDELGGMYRNLGDRIDGIVAQAEKAGSLAVAVQGLNSLRQTFDSMSRLAGHDVPAPAQVTLNVELGISKAVESLIAALGTQPAPDQLRMLEAIVDGDGAFTCEGA